LRPFAHKRDTEGSEFEILRNFNFSKWDIRTLCIEHSNASARQDIFELMTSSGYARKWSHLSKFDVWYVKRGRRVGRMCNRLPAVNP